MPEERTARLAVRATDEELAQWRDALAVAMPEEPNPSAALRAILKAVTDSPRYAREVIADVLIAGAQVVAPARADFQAATRADQKAVAKFEHPAFEGDFPYVGSKRVYAALRLEERPRDAQALENPADAGHRDGSGNYRKEGPLAGRTELAYDMAGHYRHIAELIRGDSEKYSSGRPARLESALYASIPEGERPVYVLHHPGEDMLLAVADSRDDAERIAVASLPHLIDDASGQWRCREPWLTLWSLAGNAPCKLSDAKMQLLSKTEAP